MGCASGRNSQGWPGSWGRAPAGAAGGGQSSVGGHCLDPQLSCLSHAAHSRMPGWKPRGCCSLYTPYLGWGLIEQPATGGILASSSNFSVIVTSSVHPSLYLTIRHQTITQKPSIPPSIHHLPAIHASTNLASSICPPSMHHPSFSNRPLSLPPSIHAPSTYPTASI